MDNLCHQGGESCTKSAFKGIYTGFHYGAKVRVAHAFVMSLIFRDGSLLSKAEWAVKMATNHGGLLAIFVFFYKGLSCIFKNAFQTKSSVCNFAAAFISCYIQMMNNTRQFNAINRQLCYYLLSRSTEGVYNKLIQKSMLAKTEVFPFVYVLTWGMVMFLFELDRSKLNRSMIESMMFIYKDSDADVESWHDLVPYGDVIKKMQA